MIVFPYFQVCGHFEQEWDEQHHFSDVLRTECTSRGEVREENDVDKPKGKQRKTKEDKLRMMEEKRLQKEVRLVTMDN